MNYPCQAVCARNSGTWCGTRVWGNGDKPEGHASADNQTVLLTFAIDKESHENNTQKAMQDAHILSAQHTGHSTTPQSAPRLIESPLQTGSHGALGRRRGTRRGRGERGSELLHVAIHTGQADALAGRGGVQAEIAVHSVILAVDRR